MKQLAVAMLFFVMFFCIRVVCTVGKLEHCFAPTAKSDLLGVVLDFKHIEEAISGTRRDDVRWAWWHDIHVIQLIDVLFSILGETFMFGIDIQYAAG